MQTRHSMWLPCCSKTACYLCEMVSRLEMVIVPCHNHNVAPQWPAWQVLRHLALQPLPVSLKYPRSSTACIRRAGKLKRSIYSVLDLYPTCFAKSMSKTLVNQQRVSELDE